MPPNSGSFGKGLPPGVGPALAKLLQTGTGGPLNQNSQNPNSVPIATPPPMPQGGGLPQAQNPIPQAVPPQGPMIPGAPPPGQPQPQPSPQAPQAPQLSPQDSNTQLVLKALAGYLDHVQTVNEVKSGVPQ